MTQNNSSYTEYYNKIVTSDMIADEMYIALMEAREKITLGEKKIPICNESGYQGMDNGL